MSVTLRPDFPVPHYAGDKVVQFPAPPSRIPVSGATLDNLAHTREALTNAHRLYVGLVTLYIDGFLENVAVTKTRRLRVQLECFNSELAAMHHDLLGEIGPHLIEG